MTTELRFTIHDFEGLPEDNRVRYEIIDGELYVSTSPHWRHQLVTTEIARALGNWGEETGSGVVISAPGVIFSDEDAVMPDLIWASSQRFQAIVGDDGKLHDAPELIVEVLPPGKRNEQRDQDIKLKLYSRRGVHEYWIVDWQVPSIRVYRRVAAALQLVATLYADDAVTSPLLPGFTAAVRNLCATPV